MLRIFYILKILFRSFGFRIKYLIIPFYRLLYNILNYLGLAFDELLFFNYRKVKLEKPIFIVGHPRSGTTFLHKFLIKNVPEFVGMNLWKMIFPNLFSRVIIRPILPVINKLFPKNLYDPKIHRTGFLEPETDDVALFFKEMGGMFKWLYFSALKKYNSIDILEKELVNDCELEKTLKNLEALYKKNLYRKGKTKRLFSKSFSLILDLSKLKKKFVDAKIIVLIRDPLEVVPSSMSLARNVQQNINGITSSSKEFQENYYQNLYQASLVFYKSLINQLEVMNIENEIFLLNYNDLIKNFSFTMNKLFEFCEIKKTSDLLEKISVQANKQVSYKGKHSYTLQEFGLSESMIRKDFDFLYSKFKFN